MIATIYPQLRRIAATKAPSMGGSPSSLAQETICRLIEPSALAIGCRLMEWLRIDHYRSTSARRRRELGASVSDASNPDVGGTDRDASSRRLSEVLAQLAETHPRMAEALMLSAVCRMSQEQIAATLEVSVRTIRRDLDFAKAWVASRLSSTAPAST
jgi:RNA polymerase sigma factor (sigma-70 family)